MMMFAFKQGRTLQPFSRRCFASVAATDLANVKREDVVSATDSKWMGSFVEAVVRSGDANGAHSDAINEYFRKNFRKLSQEQALDVVS